jgi:hypothetical protein
VNVVREQTAAFQRIIASLTELAKQGAVAAPMPPRPSTVPPVPPRPTIPGGHAAPPPSAQGVQIEGRMTELVDVVRRLEQRLSTMPSALPRFEVSLDAVSPSMFWRSMDGDDVVRYGGLFVATYAKLPPLGTMLSLGIAFPGGVRAECQAQVSWVQEHLGDDTPAGFGAKLLGPSSDLCAMIAQFVRHREPLLRE